MSNLYEQAKSKMGKAAITMKYDSDVVIVDAVRSPLTRARKGGLANCTQEEMMMYVFKGLIERTKIDPRLIEDVCVGNVLPPSSGASIARMATLAAGIPNTAAVNTVNRQCSSGLAAVTQIANEIATGQIDVGIGAGAESMTDNYGDRAMPKRYSDVVLENQEASDCLIPMGITSENVAKQYNVTRTQQDEFAAKSFAKAAQAQKAGYFKSEIIPIPTVKKDPKTEDESPVTIYEDDGIREGVTAQSLSKLKPAFSKDGTTHAGNASQVTDGAAAVLLMRRSVAKKLGMNIIGKFVTSVVVGVPPKIMGIGPAVAIPKLLQKAGVSKDEVDFYEVNEAFASQAIMSIETVGIPYEKVNLNGGAIALGHPLGCTGARQLATAFPIAKRNKSSLFVTSMCIGSGMGMASMFVNEQ